MKAFCLLIAVIIITASCTTSKTASADTTTNKPSSADKIENLNPSVDLANHLRTVPGLTVSGQGANAKVTIRGASSFNSDTEPLFVVDGTPINGGLSQVASMVSVADIKTIRVLKTASETSSYGMRGSNGVIEISLKR